MIHQALVRPFCRAVNCCAAAFILSMSSASTWAQLPFPTNNNPANQIRFDTAAEADAKRAQLAGFIWGGGLPTTLPAAFTGVAYPSPAIDSLNLLNVASVDRLVANVSNFDFQSTSYVLHPTNSANADRVVIVHQGHAGELSLGVGATANRLLQNGFTVVVMKMPLYGWNTDTTAVVPGQGALNYASHDDMILNTGPAGGGTGFRLFLEPVVQSINHVVATMPGLEDVSMVGLSGGGWTTQLMAAVDSRIKLSVPVAGSAPLYVRNTATQGGTVGDAEQYYVPLYNENIQPDGGGGGVATWLEMYALGGYGAGRRQVQVANEFDDCCFSGTFPNTYKTIVANTVTSLGAGQWEHVLDSTHTTHQISKHVISTVIDPAFGIAKPVPTPSNLPRVDQFNNQTGAFPGGWSLDPSSVSGTTAVESGGGVVIAGPGLSSIVHDLPFNPQVDRPITISMQLDSMSSDNAMGVFITDDVAVRPHHLGVLFLPGAKQIAVNADNGGGFDGAGDRVILGTVPGYHGGPATMSLTFSAQGFSVDFDAGSSGSLQTGVRPWSDVPNGFDVANLGENAWVFLQSFDTNGGTAATARVNSLSIVGTSPFPPGDANRDGVVDIFDVNLVSEHWGQPGPYGDVNADGVVDIFDVNLISDNWGARGGAAAVPEPCGLALTGITLLGLAGSRCRHVRKSACKRTVPRRHPAASCILRPLGRLTLAPPGPRRGRGTSSRRAADCRRPHR